MTTTKDNVRTRLLGARKAMSPKDREEADRATWNALRGFLNEVVGEGGTVAAYRPFGAEPCATLKPELPERLAELYTVLLPVTLADNDLDWTVVGSEVPQRDAPEEAWLGLALTGPKGTEGVAATCGVESIGRAEAVLVPGLAVSDSGIRLGRGGGSYDRALARLGAGVPVVALLRDGEFGVEVPAEPHDRRVSGVITPADGFLAVG